MTWNFRNIKVTFAFFIYLGLLLKPGKGQHNNVSLRDFEREILNVQCPKVDICNPNATSADLQPKGDIGFGTVSCCTSCSCHPDCEKQKNCCFPDEESLSPVDTEPNLFECLSTHMVPPGKVRRGDVPAYKTIVQPPPGGCVTSKPVKLGPNQEISPTCDNSYLPIFGSYYPVYSAETGLIYKNSLCALCHGAAKITQFVPLLICKEGRGAFLTLSAELDVFESGTLSPRCIVDYRFVDTALISKHRCYKEIVDTCESTRLRDVYGYSGVQPLDIDIVRSLCESSLYSPTPLDTKVYRNVFCTLCASIDARGNDCQTDETGRTSGGSLIHIMDPRKLKAHLNISPGVQKYPEVCVSTKAQKVERSCRRLFCSSGKIRNDNGDCEFITTVWKAGYTMVMVVLSEIGDEHNLSTSHEGDDANARSIRQAFEEEIPWPDRWRISEIYRSNMAQRCKENVYQVTLVTVTDDIAQLYIDLQTSIKAEWSINFGRVYCSLSPVLGEPFYQSQWMPT